MPEWNLVRTSSQSAGRRKWCTRVSAWTVIASTSLLLHSGCSNLRTASINDELAKPPNMLALQQERESKSADSNERTESARNYLGQKVSVDSDQPEARLIGVLDAKQDQPAVKLVAKPGAEAPAPSIRSASLQLDSFLAVNKSSQFELDRRSEDVTLEPDDPEVEPLKLPDPDATAEVCQHDGDCDCHRKIQPIKLDPAKPYEEAQPESGSSSGTPAKLIAKAQPPVPGKRLTAVALAPMPSVSQQSQAPVKPAATTRRISAMPASATPSSVSTDRSTSQQRQLSSLQPLRPIAPAQLPAAADPQPSSSDSQMERPRVAPVDQALAVKEQPTDNESPETSEATPATSIGQTSQDQRVSQIRVAQLPQVDIPSSVPSGKPTQTPALEINPMPQAFRATPETAQSTSNTVAQPNASATDVACETDSLGDGAPHAIEPFSENRGVSTDTEHDGNLVNPASSKFDPAMNDPETDKSFSGLPVAADNNKSLTDASKAFTWDGPAPSPPATKPPSDSSDDKSLAFDGLKQANLPTDRNWNNAQATAAPTVPDQPPVPRVWRTDWSQTVNELIPQWSAPSDDASFNASAASAEKDAAIASTASEKAFTDESSEPDSSADANSPHSFAPVPDSILGHGETTAVAETTPLNLGGPEAEPEAISDAMELAEQPNASELQTTPPSVSQNSEPTPQPGLNNPKPIPLNQQIAQQIETLKSRITSENDLAARNGLEVNLQLMELLERQVRRLDQQGRMINNDQKRSLQHQLSALSSMLSDKTVPTATSNVQSLESLKQAVAELEALADLKVVNGRLCTQISGFGKFKPFPNTLFKPEQSMLVYCEIENQTSLPLPEANGTTSYRTRVQGNLTIFNEAGEQVQHESYATIEDRALNRRRDFYLYFPVQLKQLPPGNYRMELMVDDIDGNKTASLEPSIHFTVR